MEKDSTRELGGKKTPKRFPHWPFVKGIHLVVCGFPVPADALEF